MHPKILFVGKENVQMMWKGFYASKNESREAIDAVKDMVNSASEETYGHKFAASDMDDKAARAVAFYTTSPLEIPREQPSRRSNWDSKLFDTSSNYELIYREAQEYLGTLTPFQQFYASVVFTNAKGNKSILGIIYPLHE